MLRFINRGLRTYSYLRCKGKEGDTNGVKDGSSREGNKKTVKDVKSLLKDAASFEDFKPTTPEDKWSTLPYPEGAAPTRDQAKKSIRPSTDPKETSIIVFPGQGTQYVGMARNLLKFPGARDIFELANDILKYDLLKLCLEGPKDKLNKTVYSQPAILVTSLASLEKLKEERPKAIDECVAAAGFSLGEITALIFTGAIPFDKGLKLVQIRAEAMQIASDETPGGMASILYGPDSNFGLACKKAEEWCLEKGIENPVCKVASYLYPHSKVVAGHLEALKYLEANKNKYSLKRIKRLQVSGAFHTDLMASAVEPFKNALNAIKVEDPIISVYSNVDGKPYKNAIHIKRQLPKQIIKPVKWEQTLHIMYERPQDTSFPRTFECGPGQGLTAILKQVNAKAFDSAMNIEA